MVEAQDKCAACGYPKWKHNMGPGAPICPVLTCFRPADSEARALLEEIREGLEFDCTLYPDMEERLVHWACKIAGPKGEPGLRPDPVMLAEICADIGKSVHAKFDAYLTRTAEREGGDRG